MVSGSKQPHLFGLERSGLFIPFTSAARFQRRESVRLALYRLEKNDLIVRNPFEAMQAAEMGREEPVSYAVTISGFFGRGTSYSGTFTTAFLAHLLVYSVYTTVRIFPHNTVRYDRTASQPANPTSLNLDKVRSFIPDRYRGPLGTCVKVLCVLLLLLCMKFCWNETPTLCDPDWAHFDGHCFKVNFLGLRKLG